MDNRTDMEKCTIYKRRGDRCEIRCRLGLWSVEGPYGLALINEANHYFQQYKADGEYDKLLTPNLEVTGLPQPDAGSDTNAARCGRSG